MTIPIGEAARRLGVNASALRYYEELGLVVPAARQSGQRRYGTADLRRAALVGLAREMGMRLDRIAVLLDADRETWRAAVRAQIEALDEQITALTLAKASLRSALACRSEHPAAECPFLLMTLEARIKD